MGVTKKLSVLVSCVVVAVLAVGCVDGDSSKHTMGGTVTFVEPQSFDSLYPPAAGFYPNGGIIANITDRLLYQDPDSLDLYPWIATSLPDVNEDATVYTFKLRKDVTFSDGTPLDAENVIKNFDVFAHGDPARNFAPNPLFEHYDASEAIDSYTVVVRFSAPNPEFAQSVSAPTAGLLANATIDNIHEDLGPGDATNIVASGPFVVAEEKPGAEVTLAARDDYNWAPAVREHQGRPAVDAVRIVRKSDDSVRAQQLVARTADVVGHVAPEQEREVDEGAITVVAGDTRGVNNSVSLRMEHPLLQDRRVRQAIVAAVDREEIRREVFTDSYPVAASILAKGAPGFTDVSDEYRFDRAKAVELLDAAGWVPGEDGVREKGGRRLELSINHAAPLPQSREVVARLQEQLKEVGVELNVYPGDFAQQVAASKDANKVQLLHAAQSGPRSTVLREFYSVDGVNALGAVDAQLEQALGHDLGQAQRYLAEQAYVVPLVEQPIVYGVLKRVRGFDVDSAGLPSFYEVSVVNG